MLCAQDTSSTRFFPLSHWGGGGGWAFSFLLQVPSTQKGPRPVLSQGLRKGHSLRLASCWEMS